MGVAGRPVYVAATYTADGRLVGVTVNSVFSVNVSPPKDEVGLVLRANSGFLRSLWDTHVFSITLLNSDQERIAREFANPGRKPLEIEELHDWNIEKSVPLLSTAHSSIAAELTSSRRFGANTLLFAEVNSVTHHLPGEPLLYSNGVFSSLGQDQD